jgi:hypothetical protein
MPEGLVRKRINEDKVKNVGQQKLPHIFIVNTTRFPGSISNL